MDEWMHRYVRMLLHLCKTDLRPICCSHYKVDDNGDVSRRRFDVSEAVHTFYVVTTLLFPSLWGLWRLNCLGNAWCCTGFVWLTLMVSFFFSSYFKQFGICLTLMGARILSKDVLDFSEFCSWKKTKKNVFVVITFWEELSGKICCASVN